MNLNPFTYRLTKETHGMAYAKDYKQTYTEIYTQPIWRYLIGHGYGLIWERMTWHIWYYLERFDHRGDTDKWHIPLSNRQEIRGFDLRHKDRVVVSRTYGPKNYDRGPTSGS